MILGRGKAQYCHVEETSLEIAYSVQFKFYANIVMMSMAPTCMIVFMLRPRFNI